MGSRFGIRVITLGCGHTCHRNAGILRKVQTQSVMCTYHRLLIASQYRHYQLVIITTTCNVLLRIQIKHNDVYIHNCV